MGTNSVCLTCLWEDETGNTVDRSKTSAEWAEEVGVASASVRRHWNHQKIVDAVRNLDTSVLPEPFWDTIRPATRVEVKVSLSGALRDSELRLALKGGDTQVGFRKFADGSYEAFHDEEAMELFVKVAGEYQPDEIDLLGDLLDLPSQGKYAKEASFSNTTQMAIDYLHEWLAKLRAVCPTAKITIVEGNHDKRMQNFVEINTLAAFGLRQANLPESMPVMSIPYLLRLDELDIEYVDAYPTATKWDNSTTRNIHGTRASSVGSTTSQYIKELPHINTWAGHTHRVEITYKSVIGPWGEAIESYSANPGCLCKSDGTVPSVKGAIGADGRHGSTVEDWQQGFGFNWYNETESWPSVYRIRDGKTIINGVEIAL
jgi:predicted phosphodiesterase